MTTSELDALLATATGAVTDAADYIRTHHPVRVTQKSDRDMVTDVDMAVERMIRERLAEATPDIGFLGEEEGGSQTASGLRWVLDPVDGTANFARGVELCAVSLALVEDDEPIVGVIHLPYTDREYTAVSGQGALCNGDPISASGTEQLHDAIVAIGDYAVGERAEEKNRGHLQLTERLATRAQRVRMFGSVAIDLAYVASGIIDAAITLDNKPWDVAAGVLIAREAGVLVLDANGSQHNVRARATVAVTPTLRDEIIALLTHTARTDATALRQP